MAANKIIKIEGVSVEIWKSSFRVEGSNECIMSDTYHSPEVVARQLILSIMPVLRKQALKQAVDLIIESQMQHLKSSIYKTLSLEK